MHATRLRRERPSAEDGLGLDHLLGLLDDEECGDHPDRSSHEKHHGNAGELVGNAGALRELEVVRGTGVACCRPCAAARSRSVALVASPRAVATALVGRLAILALITLHRPMAASGAPSVAPPAGPRAVAALLFRLLAMAALVTLTRTPAALGLACVTFGALHGTVAAKSVGLFPSGALHARAWPVAAHLLVWVSFHACHRPRAA